MICYKRKFIFIHVPKCAGTSIEDYLFGLPRSNRKKSDLWGLPNPYQDDGLQHLTATQIKTEVGDEVFNIFFKFSFVRNPWDRVLSAFLHLERQKERGLRNIIYNINSFEQFVEEVLPKKEKVHFYQSADFITSSDGKILVDFIGRYENLQKDFEIICDHLFIKKRPLPITNNSYNKLHRHKYYSDKTFNIVKNLYKKDIELFKYDYSINEL